MLADPTSEEHDEMLAWLGLEDATDSDAHSFDVDKANQALSLVDAAR